MPKVKRLEEQEPLEARRMGVALEEKVGTSRVVNVDGSKEQQEGYYCSKCKEVVRDSKRWMDHLNSRKHQLLLGKQLRALKSSTNEVLDHIKALEKTAKRKQPPSPPPKVAPESEEERMAAMGLATSFTRSKKRK